MEPLRPGDPRTVGRYRLEQRLGGGGMGRVFLGRSRGGRVVAVKVVRPEFAEDDGFRRRFTREVEAARRVGGFYTAQVVDADTEADPPWLVTAYIPGPSLEEAVTRDGPLPLSRIIPLGTALAEGLSAIHACELVHRDLKPSNVILAEDGPRVIDFGIARALDAASGTASRILIGTPSYMSPEQADGGTVGPPGDVFSFGAVLAFAATGRSPFGTGTAQAVLYRVVHDEPDLEGVTEPLAELIAACLAKDPADRPAVGDVLDRLSALDETATRPLPPEPEPEPTTAVESGESAEHAGLTIWNLGAEKLDVVIDGTSVHNVDHRDQATIHLPPGTHTVQVLAGRHHGVLRRVETRPGATTRMIFDVPRRRSGAAPEQVDELVFTKFRLGALEEIAVLAVLMPVTYALIGIPLLFLHSKIFGGANWTEHLGSTALAMVGVGVVLFIRSRTSRSPRLTLHPGGLTFDPGRRGRRKVIDWDAVHQISVLYSGRNSELVVWFRDGHRPAIGRNVQGGTFVCKVSDLFVRKGGGTLDTGLKWFAGDAYVEQWRVGDGRVP
ncbi:serine/threonine-protein kinase [Spirillospora sp. NPDC052242]